MREKNSFGSIWPDNLHEKCENVGVGFGARCKFPTITKMCYIYVYLVKVPFTMRQAQVERIYGVRI